MQTYTKEQAAQMELPMLKEALINMALDFARANPQTQSPMVILAKEIIYKEAAASGKPVDLNAQEILADLQGVTCRACGGRKPSMRSFCSKCFYKLTMKTRESLYAKYGSGYEQNFVNALNELEQLAPNQS